MSNQTNEFLDDVYGKVLDQLICSVSFLDNIDSQLEANLTQKEKEDFKKEALFPVAKSYTINMIRTMIDTCDYKKGSSKEDLEHTLDKMYGNKEYAKRNGLKKREGDIVLGITKSVILDNALFEKPVILTKDGKQYELMQDKDNFYVKPV